MSDEELMHIAFADKRTVQEILRSIFDIGVQQGRADAIEKYHKEMHDIVEGDEEFTDWQKHEILLCNDCVLEQLEEQKNDNNGIN